MFESDTVIVLTECRGLVDDTGTILVRDVGVSYDTESPVLELSHGWGQY